MDVQGVCRMLDQLDLACTYDVVYVPGQRRHRPTRGRAFVNFMCPTHAEACIRLCSSAPALGNAGGGLHATSCTALYAECQGAAFVARHMSTHLQQQFDPVRGRGSLVGVT